LRAGSHDTSALLVAQTLHSSSLFSALVKVLIVVTSIMSPFTPFFAEFLYQKLRRLHPDVNGKTLLRTRLQLFRKK
jgi:isoleucyl-tRNA synthetase